MSDDGGDWFVGGRLLDEAGEKVRHACRAVEDAGDVDDGLALQLVGGDGGECPVSDEDGHDIRIGHGFFPVAKLHGLQRVGQLGDVGFYGEQAGVGAERCRA